MTIVFPPQNITAIQTTMGFDRAVASLRGEFSRREFRVLTELHLDREVDTKTGITASRYTVLVLWHPFSAYQAVISDPNGGLMVPFNVALYEKEGITTVSVLNQPLLTSDASLGVRVLGQELNRSMRDVFLHLAAYERNSTDGGRGARGKTAGEEAGQVLSEHRRFTHKGFRPSIRLLDSIPGTKSLEGRK